MNRRNDDIQTSLERILIEVGENIKEEAFMLKVTEELSHESDILKEQLMQWLENLNAHFIHSRGHYSYLVKVIFDAAFSNELFYTQTKEERDASWYFLRFFFRYPILFQKDTQTYKYFLFITLIYGRYPGMVVTPLPEAFRSLKENCNELHDLKEFFKSLFSHFQPPMLLVKHLPLLSVLEIDCLMHVMQGKNIRTYKDLPLPVSKKHSYLLTYGLDQDLEFEDHVLTRMIICCHLLTQHPAAGYNLNLFIETCRTFRYNLPLFVSDLRFWSDTFGVWSRSDLSSNVIPEDLFDFISHQRYIEKKDYTLKRRSIRKVIEDLEMFHVNIEYQHSEDLTWKGYGIDSKTVVLNDSQYRLSEITNNRDLLNETLEMRHCAISYIEYCISGKITILSIKRMINDHWSSYLTLEVEGKKIVQIKKEKNRFPSRRDLHIVSLLIVGLGIEVKISPD